MANEFLAPDKNLEAQKKAPERGVSSAAEETLQSPEVSYLRSQMPESPLERWVGKAMSASLVAQLNQGKTELDLSLPNPPSEIVESSFIEIGERVDAIIEKLSQVAAQPGGVEKELGVTAFNPREKRDLLKNLATPSGKSALREKFIEAALKLRTEKTEAWRETERLRSPLERITERLDAARRTLISRGLGDDASHLDQIIAQAKGTPNSFRATIVLWDAETPPSRPTNTPKSVLDSPSIFGKFARALYGAKALKEEKKRAEERYTPKGWMPSQEAKQIILSAFGSESTGANAQFADSDIEYWSDQFSTSTVELKVRENKNLNTNGFMSRAELILPDVWHDKKKDKIAA